MVAILHKDREMNRSMGNYGALHILDNKLTPKASNGKVNILTHCNTGSLATGITILLFYQRLFFL